MTVSSPRILTVPAIPTPPATVKAPVVVDVEDVVFVTANPETDKISVDELNVNVESLETADPDVEELGENNTECDKLELPALEILKLLDVVAYPEMCL